jgi:hypothetical protein
MQDTIEAASEATPDGITCRPGTGSDLARRSTHDASRSMFAVHDDPRLLWFAFGVLLVGVVASAVGIARFTVGTTITGPMDRTRAASSARSAISPGISS